MNSHPPTTSTSPNPDDDLDLDLAAEDSDSQMALYSSFADHPQNYSPPNPSPTQSSPHSNTSGFSSSRLPLAPTLPSSSTPSTWSVDVASTRAWLRTLTVMLENNGSLLLRFGDGTSTDVPNSLIADVNRAFDFLEAQVAQARAEVEEGKEREKEWKERMVRGGGEEEEMGGMEDVLGAFNSVKF